MGEELGKIEIGKTGNEIEVTPGLDFVLEETVEGQTRTIFINKPNHQGPCSPEGVPPIAKELYNRILALWPSYNFKLYDLRSGNFG